MLRIIQYKDRGFRMFGINILRKLLGLDLAGKMNKYNKIYMKSHYIFNINEVVFSITEWNNPKSYTVSAGCYCNDPNVGGFDMSNFFWFWKSKKFNNRLAAKDYLNKEIKNAIIDFPETMYLCQDFETDNYLQYVNGKWIQYNDILGIKYCHACGFKITNFDEIICPNCGEILI